MPIFSLEFQPSSLAGHLWFAVPWEYAETIRDRLVAHGIAATTCLEVRDKRAAIEIPWGVTVEAVRTALAQAA